MSPSATSIIETSSLTSINSYYEDSKSSYVEPNNGGHTYTPKQLIGAALGEKIQSIDHDVCQPGDEDTFFVADLGEVYRQHMRWKKSLPRVKPHYGTSFILSCNMSSANKPIAVKCNPDPQVLRLLADLGTGFDCASKAEIDMVLNMGIEPKPNYICTPLQNKLIRSLCCSERSQADDIR